MARFLVFGLVATAMLLCLIVEAQASGPYDYKSPVYKADDKYKPAPKLEEEKKYKPEEEKKYKEEETKYKADKEKEDKEKKYKEDKYKADKEKEEKEKKYKEDIVKEKEDKYKADKEKEEKYNEDKEKEDKYKVDKEKEEEEKYKKDKEKEEKEKKYKAEEEKKSKPDYKPEYKATDEKKYKEEKPAYKPVDAKPGYAPKRVSIEGYVYCQDGSSKKPLEGAIVSLSSAKSKDMREKTNRYGYFYFPLGYGVYKDVDVNTVKIVLVSSPSKNCYIATNVNDGKSGAKVIKSKSKVVGDTLIYEVGPFAFAPAIPAYKSPYY